MKGRLGPTYRIQLTEERGFAWAAGLVPYLASLGIRTVYLSPVAEAVPGSAHGYDGTDPTRLRASLGGRPGYDRLVRACGDHDLGILVDWVPNHLSTWSGGPWWRGLLAGGRHSEMGPVFDVAWDAGPPAGRQKVALPLLDRPLADAMAAGTVALGTRDGAPVVEVAGTDLPVSGGPVRAGEDLGEVLAAQHYRLVDWHDAADRNYRRFFDIDGLCGVRVEDPDVFDRTHTLVGELARDGRLSAVRIDHLDGLRDPAGYLRRLTGLLDVPVVVEKILTGDEELPDHWPVVGTTGYEAVDDIGGALVDPDGLRRLVAAGRADGDPEVARLTVETRRLLATTRFPGELARLAEGLGLPAADLTEAVVRLDRYRTYLPADDGASTPPSASLDAADAWQRAAGSRVAGSVTDPAHRAVAADVQQQTGAVMAKGIEDTAWYRLAGPLAFCEVGGDPARPHDDGWERLMARARRRAPGLVPGTTHDTKRSLDVRCRLYALTARPGAFEAGLATLRRLLGLPAGGGDLAVETRVLGQLLLGILPPLPPGVPGPGDAAWPPGDGLAERLGASLVKGAREAKLRSSWSDPDADYEGRLVTMATDALAGDGRLTRQAFGTLVDEVARLGATLSLSAVVLRHLVPGIADCFEGDEVWNLSLVDPDNRRPLDADGLAASLAAIAPARAGDPGATARLRRAWRDGAVKQLVTARCLEAAGAVPAALPMERRAGPVPAGGPGSPLGAAAWRTPGGGCGLAVVTRLPGGLPADGDDLAHGRSFAGLTIGLSEGPAAGVRRWRELLTGRELSAEGGTLGAEEVLDLLPVAVLVSGPGDRG